MFYEKTGSNMDHRSMFLNQKLYSSDRYFQRAIEFPKRRSYAKCYALGKLTYQLPPLGPTNLLDFHLPGLGFWILLMLKIPLEPHCNNHLLTDASSCHISSQR
jgi:hypothetical protein